VAGRGEIGIDGAVLLLGRRDGRDDPVDYRFELRIGMDLQAVSGALDDFVDVRIIGLRALDFARHPSGRDAEIGNIAGFLTLPQGRPQADRLVDRDLRRPERVRETDRRVGDRLQPGRLPPVRRRRGQDEGQPHHRAKPPDHHFFPAGAGGASGVLRTGLAASPWPA